MDDDIDIAVRFEGLDEADANKAALSLKRHVDDLRIVARNQLVKESKGTLDFGATLAVIISAPAAVALANGIADWLRGRANGSLLIVDRKSQKIVARGRAAELLDAAALAAALTKSQ